MGDITYHKLYLAAVDAYPEKSKKNVQIETTALWKEIKEKKKVYSEELKRLQVKATRSKSNLLNFWTSRPKPSPAESEPEVVLLTSTETPSTAAAPEETPQTDQVETLDDDDDYVKSPAQIFVKEKLSDTERKIADFHIVQKTVGLSDEHKRELKTLIDLKVNFEKKLRRLYSNQKASKKQRIKKRKAMEELVQSYPEAAKKLKSKGSVGRPPLEKNEDMIGLHEAIMSIVVPDSSVDERRRSEIYNSCQNLDSLRAKLAEMGYNLTRTALYYRLVPANVQHIDGKRHVYTVPVKLIKPSNTLRKRHEDRSFAKSVFEMAEEFATLFDPDSVFYLSQDDKARVPLGLPVSKKQTALVMHVDYRVTLPDHDFPIGEKHKLIPSVYAACNVKDEKVTFSGPTYIAIRSARHDKSTAKTHQFDFDKLTNLAEFETSIKNKKGEIKPLIFVAVDGGPDESPSNQTTLLAWANCFLRHDVDGIFVFCNAPGFSAYNKVERRMAPLSKETAGIILPFDEFGSHLDASNKTVDEELELKNFKAAGEILASVWSKTVIDKHPVVAEYIPAGDEMELHDLDQSWIDSHVRQSRYLLQIVKCKNLRCCLSSCTNYENILGSRFLPAPVPIKTTTKGPAVDSTGQFGSLFQNLWLSHVTKTKVIE